MDKIKLTLGVALVAIVIAIGGYYYPTVTSALPGGFSAFDEVDATALKIGTNGSRVGPIIVGTCPIIMANYSIAASTTVAADCAVTGVVTGDVVFAGFATSSANFGGWFIAQSSASSTSGFITLRITNTTGATAIIPASVASTTKYLVLHPLTSVPGL